MPASSALSAPLARRASLPLRPGLSLSYSTCSHGHAPGQEVQAAPGLHLVMVLQGRLHIAYGGRAQRLGEAGRAELALISLRTPALFERRDPEGARECRFSLQLSPAWLDQAGLHLPGRHLAANRPSMGRRLQELGQGLLNQAQTLQQGRGERQGLLRLRLECQALELLSEALGQAEQSPAMPTAARMQLACELLDSGAADRWSLADIALELGLHENTLQRHFRAAQGCSVFDYLRRRRLARAHALLRQGASVAQAALEAAFENPANFATAFKKQYGVSPSRLK
ncbi:AraC-like DNA-binding protein [Paucibacter oligotrophus]|uniref:AraC-like DNA-binding protein n=1 Tax=Roseateles oligotrophus TaxID=1769250 RepID=A0A840LF06_9BURK|nr:AraC-like DNA-binding protein [Roseateles oligotrophus]